MTREPAQRKIRQFDGHAHDSVSSYDATIKPRELVDGMHESNVGLFTSVGHDINPEYHELERLAHNSGIGAIRGIEIPAKVTFNGQEKHVHLIVVNPTPQAQVALGEAVDKMWERRVLDALATMSLLKEKLPKIMFDGMNMEKVFDGRRISKYGISEMIYHLPHNKAYFNRIGITDPAQLRQKYLIGKSRLSHYVFPAEKFIRLSKEFGAYIGLAHPGNQKEFIRKSNGNGNGNNRHKSNGTNGNGKIKMNGLKPNIKYVSDGTILKLANMGIDFVEAYHPSHLPEDSERIVRVAAEANLPITIGSDIHHNDQAARLLFNPDEQNVVRKTAKKYAKKRNPFATYLYGQMKEHGVVKRNE